MPIDPGKAFAAEFPSQRAEWGQDDVGFDKPILHGLSSFGVVCKAVVDNVLEGDVTKVARYQVRFAGVVFPGETIVTSIWREGERLLVAAKTKERDTPVLSNAALELRS